MATAGFLEDDAGSLWNPWPHRLAALTAAATFLLILVDGSTISAQFQSPLAIYDLWWRGLRRLRNLDRGLDL